jgi:hypothetical protein
VKPDTHRSHNAPLLWKEMGMMLSFGGHPDFHGAFNDGEEILDHLQAVCSTFTSMTNGYPWSESSIISH